MGNCITRYLSGWWWPYQPVPQSEGNSTTIEAPSEEPRFTVNGMAKFYNPDGNIIVITKDQYHFRLHDYELRTAS
jgi:hypothetical protein